MALPLIPVALGIGAIGSRILKAAKLAAVVSTLYSIYKVLVIFTVGFWLAVSYYAKDIFAWVVETMMSMAGMVLDQVGLEDPSAQIVTLIGNLPPVMLDLWTRLNVWDGIAAIFSAYALNMALRSIPLVGGMFRG